ncbi:hypothetical protein HDU98_004794 [Podochytrium sp. JEL0797]|nr:hypothetical protein HDU98_004794 [Podochytrium sp. JEL0797]
MGSTLSSSQEHDWSKGYQPSDSNLGKRLKNRPTTSSGTLTGSNGNTLGQTPTPSLLKRKNSSPARLGGNYYLNFGGFGGGGGTAVADGVVSRMKKRGDFRKMVESKKIVIGEPISDTFQHLSHMGADDIGSIQLRKAEPAKNTSLRHLGLEDVTIK